MSANASAREERERGYKEIANSGYGIFLVSRERCEHLRGLLKGSYFTGVNYFIESHEIQEALARSPPGALKAMPRPVKNF